MLPTEQLKLALDIHSRSYKLLLWMANALDFGKFSIPRVLSSGHADDITASALDWIKPIRSICPAEVAPSEDHLQEFAAFFGTYVTTSFDIHMVPGQVLKASDTGCYCELCARLVSGSHLRAKKVTTGDKHRAENLIIERLHDLASEERVTVSDRYFTEIMSDTDLRRAAAYSTYGYWLIERTEGNTVGTAVLALWREIAWNRLGSPRKGFQLRHSDFVSSEQQLIAFLRNDSSA